MLVLLCKTNKKGVFIMRTFGIIVGALFGSLLLLSLIGLHVFGIPYVFSLIFKTDLMVTMTAWVATLYFIERLKVVRLRRQLKAITNIKNMFSEF